MDDALLITELNDYIFCPVSIYFHKMYGNMERMIYQTTDQINGTAAHKRVDEGNYSSRTAVLTGLDVYCEKYNLVGKIDIYDGNRKILRERKKRIKTIYDGYILQIYGQFFAMTEMGYEVQKLELYSMDDNKTYVVPLPGEDENMLKRFEAVINDIRSFDMDSFIQNNEMKCQHCIYEPACDRTLR